jgi:hypothetical protein
MSETPAASQQAPAPPAPAGADSPLLGPTRQSGLNIANGPVRSEDVLKHANTRIDEASKAAATEEAAPKPQPQAPEQTAEPSPAPDERADPTPTNEVEPTADEPEARKVEEPAEQILTREEYGDVLVQVPGQDEPIPLDKVLDGTLMQADYTRKRQADVAEAASRKAALDQREQELAQREAQLVSLAQETEDPEPDWVKLAEEDPFGYQQKHAEWTQTQKAKQERQQQLAEMRQKQVQEFMAHTADLAVKQYPEWTQEGSFDKGLEARKAMAMSLGFTEQEYNSTVDYRIAGLLETAVRYEALLNKEKASKTVAEKKIGKAPKVLKPGQSKGDTEPAEERRAARRKRLSQPISSRELTKTLGLR